MDSLPGVIPAEWDENGNLLFGEKGWQVLCIRLIRYSR